MPACSPSAARKRPVDSGAAARVVGQQGAEIAPAIDARTAGAVVQSAAPGERREPARVDFHAPSRAAGRVLQAALRTTDRYRALLGTLLAYGSMFGLFVLQGVLLARTLGPEQRGAYAAVVLYPQTLIYIGLLGSHLAVTRRAARIVGDAAVDRSSPAGALTAAADKLPSATGRALDALAGSAVRTGLVTGIFTAAVAILLAWLALPADKQSLIPLCCLAALMLPCEHLRLNLLAVDQGAGVFRRFNFFNIFSAATLPVALLLFWLGGGANVSLVAAMAVLGPALGAGLYLLVRGRGPWTTPVDPPPQRLLREGAMDGAAVLGSDLFGRLDMLLMLWLASLTVQGYYAAAVPAVFLLLVGPNALAIFAFNRGARRPASGRELLTAGLLLASFQAAAASAFALLLPSLVALVFGDRFVGTIPFALALIPATAFNGCTVVIDGYLRGRGKSSAGLIARLAGAGAALSTVAWLYGTHAEMSVPYAMAAGHLAVLTTMIAAAALDWSENRHVRPAEAGAAPAHSDHVLDDLVEAEGAA